MLLSMSLTAVRFFRMDESFPSRECSSPYFGAMSFSYKKSARRKMRFRNQFRARRFGPHDIYMSFPSRDDRSPFSGTKPARHDYRRGGRAAP